MKKTPGSNPPISYEKFSFSGPTNTIHASFRASGNQPFPKKDFFQNETILEETPIEPSDSREGTSHDIFGNQDNESFLISTIKESNLVNDSQKSFKFDDQMIENEFSKKVHYQPVETFGQELSSANPIDYETPHFKRTDTWRGKNPSKDNNFRKIDMKPRRKHSRQTLNDSKQGKKVDMRMKPQENNALQNPKINSTSRSKEISKILNKYNSKPSLKISKQNSRGSFHPAPLSIEKKSKKNRTQSKPRINMKMEIPKKSENVLSTAKKRETAPPIFNENSLSRKRPRANQQSLGQSDLLLFESENDSSLPALSNPKNENSPNMLGFAGNFIKNPFLKKNQKKIDMHGYQGKLKKTQSHRAFKDTEDFDHDQEAYSQRNNQFDIISHKTDHKKVLNDRPLENIHTDQSVVVPDEKIERVEAPKKSRFQTETDLISATVKIYTDIDTSENRTKEITISDSPQPTNRKSLQTIDLDEQEIRTSIKSRTQRKLSKFKILDKSSGQENNLINIIPPLEKKPPRKQSTFKKTFTREQQLLEEDSPKSGGLNKSQSMNFPPSPKRRMTISVNNQVILEVSKENSPKNRFMEKEKGNLETANQLNQNNHFDLNSKLQKNDYGNEKIARQVEYNPTSLGELVEDKDQMQLMGLNKMTDLLSQNNIVFSPLITRKRIQIKGLEDNESKEDLSLDEAGEMQDKFKENSKKNELIYKNFPTESDLLAKDDPIPDDTGFDNMDFPKSPINQNKNFKKNFGHKNNQIPEIKNNNYEKRTEYNTFKKKKTLNLKIDLQEKIPKSLSNPVSLKNSLQNFEIKDQFSQRQIKKPETSSPESLLKMSKKPIVQKLSKEKITGFFDEELDDKVLTITQNNGVKKITFSSDKNHQSPNEIHTQNSKNKRHIESNFKKKKEPVNSRSSGKQKQEAQFNNSSIIKSFRSMSVPKKKILEKTRFRCSVPLKITQPSNPGQRMFKSFRKHSEDRAKLDKEFMQTWISSGIKNAVVNLNKKMSLPNYLEYDRNSPRGPGSMPKGRYSAVQGPRNSHTEYAYGKYARSEVGRGSARSWVPPNYKKSYVQISTKNFDRHEHWNDKKHPNGQENFYSNKRKGTLNDIRTNNQKEFGFEPKLSLRDNWKFFDSKNQYYKIRLNPNEEYIQSSDFQKKEQTEQIKAIPFAIGSKKEVVRRKSGASSKKMSIKKIKTNLQFKEDSEQFSNKTFSMEKNLPPSLKSIPKPNKEVYEYEFTFEREKKKIANNPPKSNFRSGSNQFRENVSKNNTLHQCPIHKSSATHVCLQCPPEVTLKCELCKDSESHTHVSLVQLKNEDWLHALSEEKSVDSFTLFEKLEREFREIRERLLRGLDSMIVSYKKAILENSKEFLSKGMAFRAKRSQGDFFGDPQNVYVMKKLANQVNNLSMLRNAPFIENARKTTNVLIKSAVSFKKDLELLMHTYSVTTGVVTPRIKDISKSFRRNLSEMVAKIDRENQSKRRKILDLKIKPPSSRNSKQKAKRTTSLKKKVKILKDKKPHSRGRKPTSSLSQISSLAKPQINENTQRSYPTKNLWESSQGRKISTISVESYQKGQISNLESLQASGANIQKKNTMPVDKKIKLYKRKKKEHLSSNEYSLDKQRSSSRKSRTSRVKKRSKKPDLYTSDYYSMNPQKITSPKKKKVKHERGTSVEDPTSLSERSISIQKKMTKKKKTKKKNGKKKVAKALQKFIKKTNKFISQNRLSNTSSLSRVSKTKEDNKNILSNEYAFNKIQPNRIRPSTKTFQKLYKPINSLKKQRVLRQKSKTKSKRGNTENKNSQKMRRLVKLSSSFNQIPQIQNLEDSENNYYTDFKIEESKTFNCYFKPSHKLSKSTNKFKGEYKRVDSRKKKSKSKDTSLIFRSESSPKRKVGNDVQNNVDFLNLSAKYQTHQISKPIPGVVAKMNSKKKIKKKENNASKGGNFQIVYSISELNKEITKFKKRNKQLKHRTVYLENKALGFKIKNNLLLTNPGGSVKRREAGGGPKINTSKARREYMGNFF